MFCAKSNCWESYCGINKTMDATTSDQLCIFHRHARDVTFEIFKSSANDYLGHLSCQSFVFGLLLGWDHAIPIVPPHFEYHSTETVITNPDHFLLHSRTAELSLWQSILLKDTTMVTTFSVRRLLINIQCDAAPSFRVFYR